MKRIFLGSTAVLLSGVSAAHAQIAITVGGDQYFEFGYVNKAGTEGENQFRKTEMRDRTRLTINATGKADNGLEYGVRTRIRLRQQATLDFDRSWAYVSGEWGQLQFGTNSGVDDRQKVFAPNDWGAGGVDGTALEWFCCTSPQSTSQITGGDIAPLYSYTVPKSMIGPPTTVEPTVTRISYYSPRIAGFELGLSYAPSNDSSGTDINRNTFGGNNNILRPPAGAPVTQTSINYNFKDIIEAGANYSGSFAGVGVKANVDVVSGNTKDAFHLANGLVAPPGATSGTTTVHNPLLGFQTGAQVGYAGWTVGGSYTYYGNSGLAKPAIYNHADQWSWNAGIQYSILSYVFGASYLHAEDPGTPLGGGSKKLDQYVTGARYIVTKGFDLNLEYDRLDLANTKTSGARDVSADIVIFRTNVAF